MWIRVRFFGPRAVRWTGLMVCFIDHSLRVGPVWMCGHRVQRGGVTEQLRPGRGGQRVKG